MKLYANQLIKIARQKDEQRATARDRYHANNLAAKHGIELEVRTRRDGFGGVKWSCWIKGGRFEGDRFCSSWTEVREKLGSME